MPNENLLKYIKDGLAQGRTEDILRPLLLSAGWAQKDIDDAFALTKGQPVSSLVSQPQVQPQPIIQSSPQPQLQSQPQLQPQPQLRQQHSSAGARKGLWIVAGVLVLAVILVGGWAAYAYFTNPSPQQVLGAMFQSGFSNITSADNDTMISLDIHFTPASTTPSATGGAGAQVGMNPYASMLLGSAPAEFTLQAESSGTFVVAPNGSRNTDQNMSAVINTGGSGQSLTLKVGGEFRVVDGVTYIDLSTIPNVGFFNPTALEGKWIKFQVDSSTESLAQGLTGQSSLAVPSTTISPADIQKMTSAAEQVVTITKTLPSETIGGVPSYHYEYAIDKQAAQNAVLTIATVAAAHNFGGASSTLDASTTDAINASTANFLGAFTTMGGELWIGKSDHYPYQISFALAFSTSTPYGVVSGTVNVTSTLADINGGQVVSIPSGAEDIQTVVQSMLSSAAPAATAPAPTSNSSVSAFGAAQENGRDARRISDLHEIGNGLELYYNKCGYYPGIAIPHGSCPLIDTQVSTFAAVSSALSGSALGMYEVPNDPSVGATYYYGTDTAGSKYVLAARLENVSNEVFSYYTPPSLAGIKISGVASCTAPMYCISL